MELKRLKQGKKSKNACRYEKDANGTGQPQCSEKHGHSNNKRMVRQVSYESVNGSKQKQVDHATVTFNASLNSNAMSQPIAAGFDQVSNFNSIGKFHSNVEIISSQKDRADL